MNNFEGKPFITFDLETTGVNTAEDRIVQYCFIKVTQGENGEFNEEVKTAYVNPGVPIPKEASDVHGITDEMVKGAHKFSVIAPYMLPWIKDAVILGYNQINFDVPLLATEFERAGISDHGLYDAPMIDAMKLYAQYRERTLTAAFEDVTGEKMSEDAHDAEVDVRATNDVIDGLRDKLNMSFAEMAAKSIPEDMVDFAGKLKYNDNGDVVYAIGKAKGTRVVDDPGFGDWMLKNDFPNQTKKILREILKK
jgi:DNA polymerase-3 subunit epsilon